MEAVKEEEDLEPDDMEKRGISQGKAKPVKPTAVATTLYMALYPSAYDSSQGTLSLCAATTKTATTTAATTKTAMTTAATTKTATTTAANGKTILDKEKNGRTAWWWKRKNNPKSELRGPLRIPND